MDLNLYESKPLTKEETKTAGMEDIKYKENIGEFKELIKSCELWEKAYKNYDFDIRCTNDRVIIKTNIVKRADK